MIAVNNASTVDMTILRTRLTGSAQAAGVLDVAYRTFDSPVGPLLLAATPEGLVRVAFEGEDHEAVLDSLATTVSPRVLAAPSRLDPVARELEEYFAGERPRFGVAVDLRAVRGFRRAVLDRLAGIPFGHTRSYAQVAAVAGRPRAVRAAGTACATNPVPVIVPCHRVVRSDGTPGRYRGGEAAKLALLTMEGAR
ncbi:methylated-DNA--[protein]-cysteine S-methyltransferase [Amycolatopsis sp. PS_44_ISF1]|uniref:methylated-DNA--[protein]-cysteine S-methyltransferase n=1 Tax=Amycolatopsis sp. PS_44_ISF1 TaxID=2974917 RepID=UPI0028DDD585|nr:methylated-DNA--[protein]-cysteine S-methyltransferase [Amycolatopsis sp. PS_44_ISF1]MDT8911942.1 methylated-DNA--[protein]-cysteine S-methyltransferase [Amycolatopsis sp. PS_44_ISF1]